MSSTLAIAMTILAAGPVEFTGERPLVWDSRNVIVGVIEEIRVIGNADDGKREIVVRPLISLPGRFDPTSQSTVTLRAHTHPRTSDLVAIPGVGSTAMMLFRTVESRQGAKEYYVHAGRVAFFPDRQPAIISVTGLGDPRISETIERLRTLRRKAEEKQRTKEAERSRAGFRGDDSSTAEERRGPDEPDHSAHDSKLFDELFKE